MQKALGVANDDEIQLDKNCNVDEIEDENFNVQLGVWEDELSEYLGLYATKDVFEILVKILKEF